MDQACVKFNEGMEDVVYFLKVQSQPVEAFLKEKRKEVVQFYDARLRHIVDPWIVAASKHPVTIFLQE